MGGSRLSKQQRRRWVAGAGVRVQNGESCHGLCDVLP